MLSPNFNARRRFRRISEPATLICYRERQEPEIVVRQEPDLLDTVFAREVSYFVDCATGATRNTIAPVEEAVTALEMALACRQSAETSLPVRLPVLR